MLKSTPAGTSRHGAKAILRRAFGTRAGIRWTLLFLGLLAALASAPTLVVLAAPLSQSPDEGETLFQGRCAACHTVGQGDLVGPDLKDVTARRENDWLTQWILAPDRMLAEKNPIAIELLAQYNNLPMPNLGLTEPEVAAIIAYLDTQGGATAGTEPASAPVPASPKGDPAIGKNLFTGADRFRSGMAPCIACHSIAGIGALGGGTLGPDLTQSFTKYGGDDGMAAILANIPFPTMKAVFGDDLVLTPEEQADMRAFLEQASVAERPAETVWQLALLAAGGTVILLVVAHLVWRRRLGKVRRPMLTR